MKILLISIFLFHYPFHFSQQQSIELYGIRINVPDLKKAEDFYSGILHFEIEKKDPLHKICWLKTNKYKIYLVESPNAKYLKEKGFGQVSLSLQVNNLDSTIAYLKSKKVDFIKEEKREEGIGWSVHVLDPFGNALSLDELNYSKARIQEPSLYNCGVYVPDIDRALPDYEKLGLIAATRKYMPSDMPLYYPDKKFAFMLHRVRSDMPSVNNPNMMLVLCTSNKKTWDEWIDNGTIKRKNSQYIMIDAAGVKIEIRFEQP